MAEERSNLVQALDRLADRTRLREGGSHPTPSQLTAYHAGTLQQAAADAIQKHLSVCRHCADLVLDLIDFEEPAQPPLAAGYDEPDSWNELRSRLPLPCAPSATAAPSAFRRLAAYNPAVFALAAGLAGCVLGLSTWELAGRPPALARFVALSPNRGGIEASTKAMATAVRLDASAVVLVVDAAFERSFPEYRLELESAAGEVVAHSPSWTRIDVHTFLIVLTYHQVPAGTYRIRISGLENGRPSTVQVIPLRVLG